VELWSNQNTDDGLVLAFISQMVGLTEEEEQRELFLFRCPPVQVSFISRSMLLLFYHCRFYMFNPKNR